MKKGLILLLTAGFMVMLGANAMATGIGGYVDVGGGGHFYDVTTKDYTKSGDASFVNVLGGFILDTNTGGTGIFNYRMKIGGGAYVKYEREMDLKISKVDMENTFGFGIVRKEKIRFWIGPSIGVNYQWGKSESSRRYLGSLKATESYNWWHDPFPVQGDIITIGYLVGTEFYPLYLFGLYQDKIKKISFGGGSIGLTTGLNINIIKEFGIGLELGFKYDLTAGTQKREVDHFLYSNPYGKFKDDLFIHGWNLFGSVSFMYRFGER
jgi:hypothetical protein